MTLIQPTHITTVTLVPCVRSNSLPCQQAPRTSVWELCMGIVFQCLSNTFQATKSVMYETSTLEWAHTKTSSLLQCFSRTLQTRDTSQADGRSNAEESHCRKGLRTLHVQGRNTPMGLGPPKKVRCTFTAPRCQGLEHTCLLHQRLLLAAFKDCLPIRAVTKDFFFF